MNRYTSIRTLPSWCDNPAGRTIVSDIIAEAPDYFIRSGQWIEGGGVRRYKGKNAGALRNLYRTRQLELDGEAVAGFVAGKPWDEAAHELHAFYASEEPDALIERLLEGFSLVSVNQSEGRASVWI